GPSLGEDTQASGCGAQSRQSGLIGQAKVVFEADVERAGSGGDGNPRDDVLVGSISFHVERRGTAVECGTKDFGTQTDGGLKVDEEFVRGPCRGLRRTFEDFQSHTFEIL